MAVSKIVLDLAVLHGILDGAEVSIRLSAIADLDVRCNEFHQGVTYFVIHILVNVQTLGGVTELGVVLEGSPEQFGGNGLGIHIGQHNSRIVAAQLQCYPLDRVRCRAHHMATSFGRPCKCNLVDIRVAGHPLTEVVATADCIENAGRKCLLRQLDHFEVTQRRIRRGL